MEVEAVILAPIFDTKAGLKKEVTRHES
jgi:hypothetical protein